MNTVTDRCVEAYSRHKHLKLAGAELGIPWQTVYVHLKRAGVPVTGDKLRYGSDTDRLAARAEQEFLRLVPQAVDQNRTEFQSKLDFFVFGYGVDVKASNKKTSGKKCKVLRWSFSLKKQELLADFFVCFAYDGQVIAHCFLVPGEVARNYTTMSVSASAYGKWWDYEIDPEALEPFFMSLPEKD